MANILKKSAKPLTFFLIALSLIFIFLACIFSDNYRYLATNYVNGVFVASERAKQLFPNVLSTINPSWIIVDNFYWSIQSINDDILNISVVTALVFVTLMIFSSQSRNKYYVSNLIVGIIGPAITLIFAIYIFQKVSIQISYFNDNQFILNSVSLLNQISFGGYVALEDPTLSFNVNAVTLILTNVLMIILILWSVLYMVFTVLKYAYSNMKGGKA